MKSSRCLLLSVRLLGPSARPTSSSRAGGLQLLRFVHSSPVCPKGGRVPAEFVKQHSQKKDASVIVHDDPFQLLSHEAKSKATFTKVLDVFLKRDIRRRGHVEFIYAALKRMPEFGVERDLSVYNQLLDVFPKEVFVPRNFIQRMFNHYPRQQECGVQLLEQMESYGVLPNVETKVLLVQIFGTKGHPTRKYQRLMYWFPKFRHTNPFPVPQQLPDDPVDLARLSLTRIANDLDAKVTVYQLPHTDVTDSGDEVTRPHIVGVQSPSQVELLARHNPSRPLFVEGPFPLWLRKTCVYYYVLRADPSPSEEQVEDPYHSDRCLIYPLQLDLDLERDLGDEESFNVDDLDEGPVFAMCMTAHGDQASLNQWLCGLQQNNPVLGHVPTVFRLDAGRRQLQGHEAESGHTHGPQGDEEEETTTTKSRAMRQ